MGQLASYVVDKGVDDWNLGHWAWTQLKDGQGPPTHIVLVYVPCWSTGEETVYQQHIQHLQQNGIFACPCDILLHDLKLALLSWQQAGEHLVVFIDANENMTAGTFHHMLTGEGLYLQEAVTSHHPDPCWSTTATFQSGDHLGHFLIDGCFVTPDLPPDTTTWFTASHCPGDHCFVILDFHMDALVGDHIFHVVHPDA